MTKPTSFTTLTPTALAAHGAAWRTLINDNPWLIPATVALEILPATAMIHGFWKNRQLKKQLQIERERTKQLRINQYRPGVPRPLSQLTHGRHSHD